MEMKEMTYSNDGIIKLLYHEKVSEGYELAVVDIMGSHPCGYITFPDIEKIQNEENLSIGTIEDYPDIHGGFTFCGRLNRFGFNGIWIGWDYAHYGDASWGTDGNRYTTKEIANEARKALEMIKKGEYRIYTYDDEEGSD